MIYEENEVLHISDLGRSDFSDTIRADSQYIEGTTKDRDKVTSVRTMTRSSHSVRSDGPSDSSTTTSSSSLRSHYQIGDGKVILEPGASKCKGDVGSSSERTRDSHSSINRETSQTLNGC